ncbi:ABC transporter ATP-binding protein [Bacillus pumilus]|uniref:ABC transporter ATP-binding protein n=1 Tax=Bacillus pumilus TaxID=1408 RepID=UPI00017A6AF6|nr:ABC transporter ATP-binding protein [Bacillus pumilus]EDW20809.1 Nod factor export ATP-binding protein I (Nodulation ATP-binding protein I) [Bacillus pumilus ATCC 7061]MCR4353469.1 ABC transporter ATP-binding protein [Bacillus pumilus]MCY7505097.1 ABC transporter ATP-binding protein [Bacillus pumilus]MDR4269536.1 ABC transporter ATP-binding protein [Bacillus pumilus]MED4628113.1 ABC transporter ATP-binding protein [Bacillus pumilus]
MLNVHNIKKYYEDKQVLKGITFHLKKGESFGLLGPNGAGKSTLIGILTGLIHATSGTITIEGIDVKKETKKAQQMIGIVPQEIALYLHLTAKENLMFWGRMYGLKGKELKSRVQETLELIGLKDRANDQVKVFSGGMKRRVNIGCAILHQPKLLIMDEPTVGIDPQSRSHILETVKTLNGEGMTIIYTSHYMEEVEFLCERMAIMDHGSIIALGDQHELSELVGNQREIVLTIKNEHGQNDIDRVRHFIQEADPMKEIVVQGNQIKIFDQHPQQLLSHLIQGMTALNIQIISAEIVEPNLENVFLYVTSKNLRD